MKIYFAGKGHDIERTPFVDKYNWNFLLSYGGLNKYRFLWIVGKNLYLPKSIINILIKKNKREINNENIFCDMVRGTESSNGLE